MRDSWLGLVGSVLRPSRPLLERCLREREPHLTARRLAFEKRARALASCEGRIESARAMVLTANDGIVSSLMTELEREWRRLSRPDPDGGMMDLWSRVAPASWIDQKRWRGNDAAMQLDAALALAADVDGVETAEASVRALRAALAGWGITIGSRVRWRISERDEDCTSELLAEPLRLTREALSTSDAQAVVLQRAGHLERDILEAVSLRFPDRPLLAQALSHAAFVDFLWHAAAPNRPHLVAPLREIWRTGYVISALDASGVTLELPPLVTDVR